jgi:glycopeptide antibiotics resistance protein
LASVFGEVVATTAQPEHQGRADAVRRWCIVAACLSAFFGCYVGLVPFHFARPVDVSLFETFRRSAEHGIGSRANFLANILLFIPVGFFGAGALAGRTNRTWIAALAVFCLLLASGVLSLAVEILQVMVPSRTPSLADVGAQMLGTSAGIGCWFAAHRDVHAWAARHTSAGVGPLETSLWVYAAVRVIGLLLPLNVTVSLSTLVEKYRRGMIIIDPRQSFHRVDFLQGAAAELVLTAPIGILAYLLATRHTARRPVVVAVVLGTTFSVLTELAQVIVMSRTADIGDVVTGTIGVVAGVAVAVMFMGAPVVHETPGARRWWAVAGLLLSLAAYAAYNLSPFDFARPDDTAARVSMLFQLPFYSYYVGPELESVSGALLKVLLGVPVGLFCGLAAAPLLNVYPRVVTLVAVAGGVICFFAVEAGQVLLPSRYPDTTDVVLAGCGLWLGITVLRIATSTRSGPAPRAVSDRTVLQPDGSARPS